MGKALFGKGPNWNKMSRSQGYPTVHYPDHPNSWSTGHVYAHRVVMEEHIGRVLAEGEIVHHENRNKTDFKIGNLRIMNQPDHTRLHTKIGRKTVRLMCPNCKKEFVRRHSNTHLAKGGMATFCSRSCNAGFYTARIGTVSTEFSNVIEVFKA